MLYLRAPVTYSEEIKKSRFIGRAERVDDPGTALSFIERVSESDASHNCWAYRVGSEYRFSDDGEPAGTAGRPIYAAIEGRDLDHVAVVVARYFGGIKLGAGGLVRAYGGCAAKCLDRAEMVEIEPRVAFELRAGFDALGAIYPLLARFGAHLGKERYDADGVLLPFDVSKSKAKDLATALKDATRGRAELKNSDAGFFPETSCDGDRRRL